MLVKLYNMLHSHDIEENLLGSGIKIKKALAPDSSKIIAFSRTCAKDDYSDEVRAAFSNNPVTCYIATREKEIISFACYEATAKNFFGPMAVLESERKKYHDLLEREHRKIVRIRRQEEKLSGFSLEDMSNLIYIINNHLAHKFRKEETLNEEKILQDTSLEPTERARLLMVK